MIAAEFFDADTTIQWMRDNRETIRGLASGELVSVPADTEKRLDAARRLRILLHAQTGQPVPEEIDRLTRYIATGEAD